MNVEILSHNVATGNSRIRFTHKDVVWEDNYNLMLIVPSSKMVLTQLGQEFTEEMQLKALATLTGWIEKDIDDGVLKNRLPDTSAMTPPIKPPI